MDILDTLDKCKNDYKWMVEESTNHFYPDEYFTVPRIKKFPGKANILLDEYDNSFDDIIFAIPDFKNYDIFGKYLLL